MSDAIYHVPNSAGGEFRLHVNGANLELYRNNVLVDSRPARFAHLLYDQRRRRRRDAAHR